MGRERAATLPRPVWRCDAAMGQPREWRARSGPVVVPQQRYESRGWLRERNGAARAKRRRQPPRKEGPVLAGVSPLSPSSEGHPNVEAGAATMTRTWSSASTRSSCGITPGCVAKPSLRLAYSPSIMYWTRSSMAPSCRMDRSLSKMEFSA
eukprot:scaffold10098_cov107-Isochrysis_galbana.AAC.2